MQHTTPKAILMAVLGYFLFSCSDAAAKWLAQTHEIEMILVRTAPFFMLTLLGIYLKWGGLKRTLRSKHKYIHLGRCAANIMISILVIHSFLYLPLMTVNSIIFTAPFISVLLAIPIFGERPAKHGWVAIAAGFGGILLITRPGMGGFQPPMIYVLLAAFFVSSMVILARKLPADEPVLSFPFYPILSNIACFSLYSAYKMLTIQDYVYPPWSLDTVFCCMVIGTALPLGVTLIATAYRNSKYYIVGPFHYLQIIWVTVFGYIIFGDFPDFWTFAGAGVIIAGGLYMIIKERPKKPKYEPLSPSPP